MLKSYETVFIMTPVLSEEQAKETVSKYEKLLADLGAKVTHKEPWGLRRLAYPIQKKNSGFYHLMQFEAEGSVIAALEVEYKRDERLLRFLTVNLDKHGLAYAERRRNKAKDAKLKKETAAAEKEKAPTEKTTA